MDNRFSVADSEWSVDESEGNERYSSYPISDGRENNKPLYDLPPSTNQGHIMSIEEEIEIIRSDEKSTNGEKVEIKHSQKKFKGQKWMKLYIAVLTVFVLALTGFLIYIAIRDSNSKSEPDVSSEDTTITARSNPNQISELELMKEEMLDIKIKLNVILDTLRTKSPGEKGIANLTMQPNGCRNGHPNLGGICYAPVLADLPITQPQAFINCWASLYNGKLAVVNSEEIENTILGGLNQNTEYWADHNANNEENASDGTCAYLKKISNSFVWTQCSCYTKYKGFICQYNSDTNL